MYGHFDDDLIQATKKTLNPTDTDTPSVLASRKVHLGKHYLEYSEKMTDEKQREALVMVGNRWIKSAADSGDPDSAYAYSNVLLKESLRYLEMAAMKGNSEAMAAMKGNSEAKEKLSAKEKFSKKRKHST